MNPKQWQWLTEAASRIPGRFSGVKNGSVRTEEILGERVINGRRVKLSLVAEVVDTGRDPLASHGSQQPGTIPKADRPDTQHRRRTRPKRG